MRAATSQSNLTTASVSCRTSRFANHSAKKTRSGVLPRRLLGGLAHFEDIPLEPIDLTDSVGETHRFYFRTRLHGSIVALDAFELRDGRPSGYQCQVIGNPEQELLALLAKLIERLRRLLSIRHLATEGEKTEIAEQTVRGRIDWDESAVERTPLLVIDGREISWNDFGRMLSAFEGWQFKLEIVDRSDEI